MPTLAILDPNINVTTIVTLASKSTIYLFLHILDQWYSIVLFRFPQMYFLFNFVPPKLLVYNSS
jgi:hypothetical protein